MLVGDDEAFGRDVDDLARLGAGKRRLEIVPLKAAEMVELIEEIYKTPKPVVERVRKILLVDEPKKKKK